MTRIMKIAGLLTVLLVMASCGSTSPTGLSDDRSDDNNTPPDVSRDASWAFERYFLDSVTSASTARWARENVSGYKQWVLSNTSYSGGKAWVIGQNYWNRETDNLTSNAFTIPAGRVGNRFAFWARWNIAEGDYGYVEVGNLTLVEHWDTYLTFTNGSNPDYPGWTKYTLALPDTLEFDRISKVRFRFTSDTSVTGWGFGVDSVSVYQRKVTPPENVMASDGMHANEVDVDWTIPNDPLGREGWKIYRRMPDGAWMLIHTAWSSSQNHYNDTDVVAGTIYEYKVTGFLYGYLDSPDSNIDSGYALGGT